MWIGMDVTYIVAVIDSPLSPNCSGKRSTIHICVSIMRSMNERKNVFMCRPTNPERARAHKALSQMEERRARSSTLGTDSTELPPGSPARARSVQRCTSSACLRPLSSLSPTLCNSRVPTPLIFLTHSVPACLPFRPLFRSGLLSIQY